LSDEKDYQSGQEHPSEKKKKKKGDGEDFPLQEYRLVPVEEWDGRESGDDEIDLIELAKHIWDNRSTIYKFVAVGVVLGLAVALLSPKEYQSGATLMPEMPSSQSGASSLLQQYGGLLGMGGSADLGQEGMIPPMLYPQIVQSLPFQLELLNFEVDFPKFETRTTVYNFFDEVYTPSILTTVKAYTVGLPGKMIGLFREETEPQPLPLGLEPDSIVSVTKDQMEIINNLRDRVSVSLNEESGVINLTTTMPDPQASAQVARISIGLIREYVTDYRTRKAEQDLIFARRQMESAREEFEAVQDRLAEFRDSNINLSTARAQTQEQRLQSEYDLAFNVYNTVAQQVEQAKLKVQEQTPVVSVLQPVHVPVDDETSGFKVLFLFTFLIMMIGIALIVTKYVLMNKKSY
jgi:uncharacterized protein involved in exopolysaccharide biosynthesis